MTTTGIDVGRIGVGITVQDRFEATATTVRRWKDLIPDDAVLVIVDDGSRVPYSQATYRFETPVGIPRAKNKCLELLIDAGVEEIFLCDSDCYPTTRNWWKPYVSSPEPHLSYQFLDLMGPNKLKDMKEIYRDSQHVAYTGQRGCLLYYHKSAIDRVGGFDPIYGRGLYEHSDLANRIHAAGLTTWRYADVVDSHKLWYSMDEHILVNRTIPKEEQHELVKRNAHIHNTRRVQDYQAYVPYRETHTSGIIDILITTLLTRNPDPQRGYKWNPDPALLSEWLESVEEHSLDAVVLADELKKLPRGYSALVESVRSSKLNIYYQRWVHIYQFLRDHPEIRFAWCTDGTDVVIQKDPFEGMLVGKLYVGCETGKIGDPWMRTNHPARKFQKFFDQYKTHTMLNAGVVGADRETLMLFAQKMITVYSDIEAERFWQLDKTVKDIGDMAAFNYVALKYFGSSLVYGPQVTTEFKAYQADDVARFRHK